MSKPGKSKPTENVAPVMTFHRESEVIESPTEAQVMNTIFRLRDSEAWCELRRPGWTIRASRIDNKFHMFCRDVDDDHEYQRKPDESVWDAILEIFLSFRRRKSWSAKIWDDLNAKADKKMSSIKTEVMERMRADGILPMSNSTTGEDTSAAAPSWWSSFFNVKGDDYYNSAMVCPHCQVRGKIHTMDVEKKVGISGGKATAGLLTGGLSLFVVGLSRKETTTKAHCHNCNATWHF